ncbi:centromere-associated protein E-like [Sceloporus undulatus]|uniref:centromere-associated protein E-like n=1 Tax=Sceloporus undulatus TaxID=8520 RepID=UPI001C4D110D|nr:centromere-associated protein E-like [Sceloporus undulatus]
MEHLNKMKQLETTIESLQKEKVDLLQRIRGAEECLRLISQEKSYLNILVADLQSDRDIVNRNMVGLSKTIEKTVAANLELQERLRATTGFTKGCHEILQEAKAITFLDKSTQLSDGQERQDQANQEANQKVEQLTAELNLQIIEKEQLLADNKWRKENLQQVVTDNAYLKKVMAVFWETVSSLKTENECLRGRLMTIIDKEMAAKLPIMEKKKKYIEKVSCNLKSELDRMKMLTARTIPRLLPANAVLVKRLQTTYDQTSFSICCLLDEVKVLGSLLLSWDFIHRGKHNQ